MGKKSKSSSYTDLGEKTVKAGGKVIGLVAVVPAVVKFIDEIEPILEKLIKPKPSRVLVPHLYSKETHCDLEEATNRLITEGFKVTVYAIKLDQADAKYKDCFDMQVVDSDPKQGSKQEPGSCVMIKYVTQSVIDESRKIFEESERHKAETKQLKAETKQLKAEQRTEHLEQAKQKAKDVSEKAKTQAEKVKDKFGKKEQAEQLYFDEASEGTSEETLPDFAEALPSEEAINEFEN